MKKHLLATAIIASMIGVPALAEQRIDHGYSKGAAKHYSRDKHRVEKDHRKHYKKEKHANKHHERREKYADYKHRKYEKKHRAEHRYNEGYQRGYKQATKQYKKYKKHNYKNHYKHGTRHYTSYSFNTYPQISYRHNNHGNAAHGEFFYDYGRVKSVTPIFDTVKQRIPHSNCSHSSHKRYSSNSATPAIIGGIIGAAIGNELGHSKRNKQVGAVAGGLLGASIGSDLKGNGHRCVTQYSTEYREQVVGYDVSYRYKGRTYYTQTSEHPGKRIQLKLRVDPITL